MADSGARRWPGRLALALVVAAVFSPVLRDRNSFPLSTYPIYANDRAREATLATVIGITADGEIERLGLGTIADTDDPLIAESLVSNAIRAGSADDLCVRVAARADDLAQIQVVEERHDVVDFAAGRDSLIAREVHATCPGAG